jgi:hypothetical protein
MPRTFAFPHLLPATRRARCARAWRWRRSAPAKRRRVEATKPACQAGVAQKRLPRARSELHESTQWTSGSEGDGPCEARNARRAWSIPPSPQSELKPNLELRGSVFLLGWVALGPCRIGLSDPLVFGLGRRTNGGCGRRCATRNRRDANSVVAPWPCLGACVAANAIARLRWLRGCAPRQLTAAA